MKKIALFILAISLIAVFIVFENDKQPKITGNSPKDTGTVRITIGNPPTSGGGGGGGSSGQSSTVSPAVYGRATSIEKSKPQEVENYYKSQDLKFAPITTSVATLKSPAERGRLSTATKTFLFGLTLIVLAILIALILSHSYDRKKHRFKRNKV